jgi:hypothetical protein
MKSSLQRIEQIWPHIWVRDRGEQLGSAPDRLAAEIDHTVFRGDVMHVPAGCDDARARF